MWLYSPVDWIESFLELVSYCLAAVFLWTVHLVVCKDCKHRLVDKVINLLLRLALWFSLAAHDSNLEHRYSISTNLASDVQKLWLVKTPKLAIKPLFNKRFFSLVEFCLILFDCALMDT